MAKKRKIYWKDEELDSTHELYFIWYLEELKEKGIILDHRKSKSYPLTDSLSYKHIKPNEKKVRSKLLLKSREYTPDRDILWNSKYYEYFVLLLKEEPIKYKYHYYPFSIANVINGNIISIVDVKNPSNSKGVHDLFSINQKEIYYREKIFVEKIIVRNLFNTTFTPKRFLYNDKGDRKRNLKSSNILYRSLNEYIRLKNNERAI